MAKVTIEGSRTTPSVVLAPGQRKTVALTDRVERLIAKGFVVEVERFSDVDDPAAGAAAELADQLGGEFVPDGDSGEELKQAHVAAVADPVIPSVDETEHSPYAVGGLVSGPTTMPSSLEQ